MPVLCQISPNLCQLHEKSMATLSKIYVSIKNLNQFQAKNLGQLNNNTKAMSTQCQVYVKLSIYVKIYGKIYAKWTYRSHTSQCIKR